MNQVVAAGTAFSERARDVATIVKLVRNTLMAPLIVVIGLLYARSMSRASNTQRTQMSLGKIVPWFVAGFILLVLVRTAGVALGIFPQDVSHPGSLWDAAAFLKAMDEASKFAILMALSAIGLGTDMGAVRKTGLKPVLVGIIAAGRLGLISLCLILLVIRPR